jgi:hypothetical protein
MMHIRFLFVRWISQQINPWIEGSKLRQLGSHGKAGNTTGGKSSVFLSDTVAWNST